MLILKCEGNDKRSNLNDGSSLISRTMLTRPTLRSYATSLSITGPLGESHQGALLRYATRTCPARLRGPGSLWEELRPSIHFSVCLPPLAVHLPQKMNMNFSCLTKSPFTLCNSHGHLWTLLKLSSPVYNEMIGLDFV